MRWLVVDLEADLLLIERQPIPDPKVSVVAYVHPSALVVVEAAR